MDELGRSVFKPITKATKQQWWKMEGEWMEESVIEEVGESYIVAKNTDRAETVNNNYSPTRVWGEIVWSERKW